MKKLDRRIVVVTRQSRLEAVLARQNTLSQARFYITSLGGDFDDYEMEHRQYQASLSTARQELEGLCKLQWLDRKYLPNFIFAPDDIVLVIGQDGLVANTLKYLDRQPVIGINPDPTRWDGVLLPFKPDEAARIIRETLAGRRRIEEVSMAKARLQNGQELLAVNDFFIGQRTHVSARYVLKYGELNEPQSSSGVIVSTGLGSTGWMKSIIAGASRISSSVIGHPYGSAQESDGLSYAEEDDFVAMSVPMQEAAAAPMQEPIGAKKRRPSELSRVVGKWSSEELLFAVREPFPSKSSGTNLVFGKLTREMPLRIESRMGENGVIFSDGMEADFLSFNSGAEALITLAEKRGQMVI